MTAVTVTILLKELIEIEIWLISCLYQEYIVHRIVVLYEF